MQAESGQSLETILRRKELERASGNGYFYWGIGNSLGDSTAKLLNSTSTPEVLFSVMRTKPKPQDASPDSILIWSHYESSSGTYKPLPPHALVLSRESTASGLKKRCYALVCYSTDPLVRTVHGFLDVTHLKNLSRAGARVGFSQVTANVEHECGLSGSMYEINLRSKLRAPFFIKLAGSKRLLAKDRALIQAKSESIEDPLEWREFVNKLRTNPRYSNAPGNQLEFPMLK